jgi:hypothetical protein
MIEDGVKFLGVDASVPTPENRSSQSNGLSSMVTIEEIAEKVGAINGGGSEYTETIVNISSAEIFNSTTTAIELLPALTDNNKYYDIQKIIFEYQGGDTEFSYDGSYWNIQIRDNDILFLLKPEILTTTDKKYAIYTPSLNRNADSGSIFVLSDFSIGSSLYIISTTDDVITQGNGTLRVKIYHKTITFGA